MLFSVEFSSQTPLRGSFLMFLGQHDGRVPQTYRNMTSACGFAGLHAIDMNSS